MQQFFESESDVSTEASERLPSSPVTTPGEFTRAFRVREADLLAQTSEEAPAVAAVAPPVFPEAPAPSEYTRVIGASRLVASAAAAAPAPMSSQAAPSPSTGFTRIFAAAPPPPPTPVLRPDWVQAEESQNDRDYANEAIKEQLADIEAWALGNRSDARKDLALFWLLKIPAICVSALSALFVHFNLTGLALVAGTMATICAVVDGMNPRGKLRNAHWKAFAELRILENRIKDKWMIAVLKKQQNLSKSAAELIQEAIAEKNRISAYLVLAETIYQEQPKPRQTTRSTLR